MEVGLTSNGSAANSSTCKSSTAFRLAVALSGGSWANAGDGPARAASKRARRVRRDMEVGAPCGRREGGNAEAGAHFTSAGRRRQRRSPGEAGRADAAGDLAVLAGGQLHPA